MNSKKQNRKSAVAAAGFVAMVADGVEAMDCAELNRLADVESTIARLNAAGEGGFLTKAEDAEIGAALAERAFILAKRGGASPAALEEIRVQAGTSALAAPGSYGARNR